MFPLPQDLTSRHVRFRSGASNPVWHRQSLNAKYMHIWHFMKSVYSNISVFLIHVIPLFSFLTHQPHSLSQAQRIDCKNSDSFELHTCSGAASPLGGAVGLFSFRWDESSSGRLLDERRYQCRRSQSTHTPAITGWRIGSALFNLSAGLGQRAKEMSQITSWTKQDVTT